MPVGKTYLDIYKIINLTSRTITLGDLVNVSVRPGETIDLLKQPMVNKERINQSADLQNAIKNGQLSVYKPRQSSKTTREKQAILASIKDADDGIDEIRTVSMPDATSFTPTPDTADINTQTNTQPVGILTANAPSGSPSDNQKIIIKIKSTNVQTYAWDTVYRGSTTLALPISTSGGGQTDYIGFMYSAVDNKWDILAYSAGY